MKTCSDHGESQIVVVWTNEDMPCPFCTLIKELEKGNARKKELEDKLELIAECASCNSSNPKCKDCYIVTGKKS